MILPLVSPRHHALTLPPLTPFLLAVDGYHRVWNIDTDSHNTLSHNTLSRYPLSLNFILQWMATIVYGTLTQNVSGTCSCRIFSTRCDLTALLCPNEP